MEAESSFAFFPLLQIYLGNSLLKTEVAQCYTWHHCVLYIPFLPRPSFFFSFGATAPIWVLAYLHETLRLTSVY
jgi:hypothetical protein